ncbi:MAG: SDR family oxidoreductase [Candidatus Paceibacterota bacterium]
MKKQFLIVGGTGSIGGAIADEIFSHSHSVVITGKKELDVTNEESIRDFFSSFPSFDGMVYAVGSCPPKGYMKEIETPLSKIDVSRLSTDFNLHVVGLLRVVQQMKGVLKESSPILVISSGITRIPDCGCPANLYAGHYATIKASQNELVKWLRRDPFIREKGILIHRLGVGAVDTPFHEGASEELKPPILYSLEEVAKRAIKALDSRKVVDYDFNPIFRLLVRKFLV